MSTNIGYKIHDDLFIGRRSTHVYVIVINSRSPPMIIFLPVAIGQNNTVHYVNWLGWALNAQIPRLKYVKSLVLKCVGYVLRTIYFLC